MKDVRRALFKPYASEGWLVVDIPRFQAPSLQSAFVVFKLRCDERPDLTKGRFARWSESPLPHQVRLSWPTAQPNDQSPNPVECCVDWISEMTAAPWTMRALAEHSRFTEFPIEFQFEDPREAVHFALRWRGE